MKRTNHQKKHERNVAVATLGISLALIVALHALAEGFAKLGLFSLALGIIPVLAVSQLKDWRYGLILGTFFGVVSLLTAVIKGYAGLPVWHNMLNPLITVLPRAVVGLACSLLSALAALVMKRIDARHALTVTEAPIAADGVADSEAQAEENALTEQAPQAEENAVAAQATEAPATTEDAVTSAETSSIFAPDQPDPVPTRVSARKVGKITVEYLVHAVITFIGVILNAVGFLGMLLVFARGEQLNGADFNLLYVLEFVVGTNTLIEAIVFTVLVPAIVVALKRAKVFAVR